MLAAFSPFFFWVKPVWEKKSSLGESTKKRLETVRRLSQ
jgi:hypothetical protein